MSFVYSSNSPEFLNYIAHTKTRADIVNDPSLCVLLEDPHIKDNMETALLYKDAQYGDYDAKKEFLGHFLANAPELDTDTIMYFRDKIINNPECMEIYRNEFPDISYVDDLRINKYGKNTSDTDDLLNCLQNPCEYLGPFSSSIGIMGDDRNFNTISNVLARITSGSDDIGTTTTWGNIRQHAISKIIPNVELGYRTMMAGISQSFNDFAKKFNDAGLGAELQTVGDSKAESYAKDISTAVKVNVISNLGDCSRIWENMRRLRVYDPSKNAKKPLAAVGNKTADGTPAIAYTPSTDAELSVLNNSPGPATT